MSRVWIVTGCSTGIGRAIAEYLLEEGHRVAVTARKITDVADLETRYPDQALAIALDVTRDEQVRDAIAATIARFGTVDALVNNAGYGYVSSIEEGEIGSIQAMFDTNLFGALRMMQAVLPHMRAQHSGLIVNISSLAGRIANPATGFYASSKHALEAMSEAASREVEPFGIRVCAVAPGMFRSEFSGRSLKSGNNPIGDYADTVHQRIELVRSADGRQPGDPRKLAAMVMALADMDDPPRQLVAGPDAYAAIIARTDEIRTAMERHRTLSVSTDFDAPQ
ncbi:oxidoreductase [Croceicoccus sp. F390]|uniref:Oxidoreductase n=1 Tax=Croceicoccus esteveae TaxID=3075597 RepID=A0ABU2ZGZ2_9SPHN|nr:oxidoreductase [Croceicoccus sp. F390]MDT0575863.1 oxidoreductase [Croceicoccus sp. F390]